MLESITSPRSFKVKQESQLWFERGSTLSEEERRQLGEARNREWLEAKARGLSKNQWRKEKRLQTKLVSRPEARAAERARRKANKAIKKANGTFKPAPPKRTMAESTQKQKVAIDLDFVEIAETIGVFQNWDIHLKSDKIDTVFKPNEIVYLTAESENVLTELDESVVYVIGGLVDHNHHKGLCHGIAIKKGYRHARLAIEENVKLDSRKVLTINHVFDIFARYTVHKNWKTAFDEIIPSRKRKAKSNTDVDALEAKFTDKGNLKTFAIAEPPVVS